MVITMNDYEVWELPVGTLEYYDEDHLYIFNGEILPSITQILKVRFGNKYFGISKEVLNKAAEKGTALHEAIQDYEELNFDDITNRELSNYKFLKKHFKWKVLKSEIPVIIFWNYEEKRFATNEEIEKGIGKPIACGRLDQLIEIDNEKGINDLKRTSVFDKEYVCMQTNIYKVGVLQTYNIETSFVSGTHLRESTRKFYRLPVNQKMTEDLINEYLGGK